MGYLFQYFAVSAFIALLKLTPLALSGWLVMRVADLFYFCSSKRRAVTLENVSLAYGSSLSNSQKETLARKSLQNQALSILELFLVNKIKKNSSERFSISGEHYFDEAVAQGKGIVFVASHLGSWEYIGFPGYLKHFPHSVIIKKIKNPYLDRAIDSLRRETDTVPIPKINAIRQSLSELHKNHGVAVIIDQWAGKEGVWSDFFGRATSTTSLPARLAKKTGCALIPIYCLRKAIGQYEIQMLPAVPLPDAPDWEMRTTNRLNEILESQIRKYPEQWSWSHERWKPKPLTTRVV